MHATVMILSAQDMFECFIVPWFCVLTTAACNAEHVSVRLVDECETLQAPAVGV
jgi:hypothetical protein